MKILRAFLFSPVLFFCAAAASRADVVFLADSGFVNVKERYGAKGDGITDDTAAFQKSAAEKAQNLYLPAGTYLVSDTLLFLPKRWVLQGQDREKTILRLADGGARFQDEAKPKPSATTSTRAAARTKARRPLRSRTASSRRATRINTASSSRRCA